MREYSFVSEWHIEAPIERVFDALVQSEDWPRWWPSVRAVEELQPGDERRVGNVRRYTFRGSIPYSLTFDMRTTRVEPPRILHGAAVGQLEGEGRWYLEPAGAGTHVRYEWDVRTNRRWMNALAPVLRPLFVWNHDRLMSEGERGLRRYLGAG